MIYRKFFLGNADFSWLTGGSYLKTDNGKYCAGYAVAFKNQTSYPPETLGGHKERALVCTRPRVRSRDPHKRLSQPAFECLTASCGGWELWQQQSWEVQHVA